MWSVLELLSPNKSHNVRAPTFGCYSIINWHCSTGLRRNNGCYGLNTRQPLALFVFNYALPSSVAGSAYIMQGSTDVFTTNGGDGYLLLSYVSDI